MSLSIYEYSQTCDVRSIALTVVKTCSNAIFEVTVGHGKSPCFLRCAISAVVDVDSVNVDSSVVDVKELLE